MIRPFRLQGPYVYALYDYYKFTKKEVESVEMSGLACKSEEQIGVLFIVGFGSSAVFGVFAGSFADKCWLEYELDASDLQFQIWAKTFMSSILCDLHCKIGLTNHDLLLLVKQFFRYLV